MARSAPRDREIRARAWCRVDLGGGTLDIWPLGLLFPGARTVNVAIDVPVTVAVRPSRDGRFRVRQAGDEVEVDDVAELRKTPQTALPGLVAAHVGVPPVEIELESRSPRGGGLGASSAMTVALIAALDRLSGRSHRSPDETARLGRDLEARLMGRPTGVQDHYPALLGGALELRYEPGGPRVDRFDVDLDELGASLLVAYTGQTHVSGLTNWEIVRGCLEAEPVVRRRFEEIVVATNRLARSMAAGDLAAVGRAMSEEWTARAGLADGVDTPLIEGLLSAAREAGAWGGKACGAGGGGCVAILAPPRRRAAVAEAIGREGGEIIPARPAADGLQLSQR